MSTSYSKGIKFRMGRNMMQLILQRLGESIEIKEKGIPCHKSNFTLKYGGSGWYFVYADHGISRRLVSIFDAYTSSNITHLKSLK